MKTQEPSTKKDTALCPALFSSPTAFSCTFAHLFSPAAVSSSPSSPLASALLPTLCLAVFTCQGGRGSTLFPCPTSSKGCNLPSICHPAPVPAPALCLPLPKELYPGAAAKPQRQNQSLSSHAGFLQRNPTLLPLERVPDAGTREKAKGNTPLCFSY